jgi:hypothetical protein
MTDEMAHLRHFIGAHDRGGWARIAGRLGAFPQAFSLFGHV